MHVPHGKLLLITGAIGSFAAIALGAAVGDLPVPVPTGQTLMDTLIMGVVYSMYRDLKKGQETRPARELVKENHLDPVIRELKDHRAAFSNFAGETGARLDNLERSAARAEARLDDVLQRWAKP